MLALEMTAHEIIVLPFAILFPIVALIWTYRESNRQRQQRDR